MAKTWPHIHIVFDLEPDETFEKYNDAGRIFTVVRMTAFQSGDVVLTGPDVIHPAIWRTFSVKVGTLPVDINRLVRSEFFKFGVTL